MSKHSTRSDQELFQQLDVIRDVATNVKEKSARGEKLSSAAEAAARITVAETKSIIEELQRRGHGQ